MTLQARSLGEHLEAAKVPQGRGEGGEGKEEGEEEGDGGGKDEEKEKKKEKKEEGDGESSELDEFSKAAITSLNGRNLKKKEALAEKKKLEKAAKAASAAGALKKKPAAAAPMQKENKRKMEVQQDIESSAILKAMPKDAPAGNPLPVRYGGGVVYTVQHLRKFRCLRTSTDKYSEFSKQWGHHLTKKEAWKACIDAIDEHNAKKRKKHKWIRGAALQTV